MRDENPDDEDKKEAQLCVLFVILFEFLKYHMQVRIVLYNCPTYVLGSPSSQWACAGGAVASGEMNAQGYAAREASGWSQVHPSAC